MFDAMLGGLGSAIGAIGSELLFGDAKRDREADIRQQNYEHQKEFASNAISWKVADALRSGVHPLYALGASTTSFSPSSVGGDGGGSIPDLSGSGQDIGRAMGALLSPEDRVANRALQANQVRKTGAEADLLEAQAANERKTATEAPGTPPPLGQVGSMDKTTDPMEIKDIPLPSHTGHKFMGYNVFHAPDTSDMEKLEDRYGDEDPVNKAHGMAVRTRDVVFTLAWNGYFGEGAQIAAWNTWYKAHRGQDLPYPKARPRRFGEKVSEGAVTRDLPFSHRPFRALRPIRR